MGAVMAKVGIIAGLAFQPDFQRGQADLLCRRMVLSPPSDCSPLARKRRSRVRIAHLKLRARHSHARRRLPYLA